MRGDFSRIRFNRRRGYTAVLEQQGRVALDADANEQCFIADYLDRTETVDVIGEYGGPRDDAGFAISVSGSEIMIGAGRYYVDGLLCENDASLSYDDQPYLLDPSHSAVDLLTELARLQGHSVVQVYLEAWQRFVIPLDDHCLREPALGQADTTGRLQTVWRVVATVTEAITERPTHGPRGLSPCCQTMYGLRLIPTSGGIDARTSGATGDCGCDPVPAAGYQGVENQLYRIEVHTGGDETQATFKWSRENGSVVSAVTNISGATVHVNSLGPDANLGYQVGQWVELSDDNNQFGQVPNQAGALYQIQSIQAADPSVTLAGPVTPVNPAQRARLRRWDQSGPAASAAGIPLSSGTWIELENGIEVCFDAGHYNPGDYWTIPARTATGTIEWPPCGDEGPRFVPPETTKVHRAPLACIHWSRSQTPARPVPSAAAVGTPAFQPFRFSAATRALAPALFRLGRNTVDDCRLLFDPLTTLSEPKQVGALHIAKVNWVNDDITTLDALTTNGLVVELDQAPTGPINGANFIVTIEPVILPGRSGVFAAGAAQEAAGGAAPASAGGQGAPEVSVFAPGSFLSSEATNRLLPATILREITILDSEITVKGQTISWLLPSGHVTAMQRLTILAINELVKAGAAVGIYARVRIKLLGEMIFATGASGPIYLDGRSFGQQAVRADGKTPRIDLQLPSGADERASDLDSWFYVAPTLGVESVTIDSPKVTPVVDGNDQVTGVTAGGQPVTPTATVTLTYAPVTSGQLTITITQDDGPAVTLPSVPGSEPFTVGQRSVAFPIAVLANPGPGSTSDYTITATLTGGIPASAATTFTVVGAQFQRLT
ncbi:MAG: DUF6519 domain-containing protein [Actinomycetota bacterium]|nr:DUF6519 domain-containing protein [Actinomycetota bacterium]